MQGQPQSQGQPQGQPQPQSQGQPQGQPQQYIAPEDLSLPKTTSIFAVAFATLLLILALRGHQSAPDLPPAEQIEGFFNWQALRFKLFESGPIPYLILWTFLFGVGYLIQILWQKERPIRQAKVIDKGIIDASRHGNQPQSLFLGLLAAQGRKMGYYAKRLSRLLARWLLSNDITAVIAFKNEILENDEENVSLSFVAVRWCEWALPLLGFLGTVLGFAEAIGGMKEGVKIFFNAKQLTDELRNKALDYFNQGFEGLAVAFDTTFMGLAGLIIIGGLHLFMKKRIAAQLAEARDLFTIVVSNWNAVDVVSQKVDELKNIVQNSMKNLNVVVVNPITRIEDAIQESENRSARFRSQAKTMFEQVIEDDPQYAHIKQVLFRPVVEFNAVQSEFVALTRQTVEKQLGRQGWSFRCIAVSSSPLYGLSLVYNQIKSVYSPLGEVDLLEQLRRIPSCYLT